MILQYETLIDKIKGCWLGKNAGGVLGAPFEGKRQLNNIDYYVQENIKGNPPPNDDLDLQLVWLNAAERYGRNADASILGEYWLSFIIPDWVEYGTGKTNLRQGLMPPISGSYQNNYKNSCGSFIRSEIWASLCPGHPGEAVRFAYEDAIVDHGDEGLYAEVFCAAVQSAAFVINDKYELIKTGLSYIPEECETAKVINFILEKYQEIKDYVLLREELMNKFPGTFGIQWTGLDEISDSYPLGKAGHDVVNNIGILIIAWLCGEDDFGKSLCIAVNCGEDTDCTAGTLGAIFGIIHGKSNLPERWINPLGDTINTFCINMLSGLPIPSTVTELTERIVKLIPMFLNRTYNKEHEYCRFNDNLPGYTLETLDGKFLLAPVLPEYLPGISGAGKPKPLWGNRFEKQSEYTVKYSFPMFTVIVDYRDNPYINLNVPRKIKVRVIDSGLGIHQQYFANFKFFCDEGVSIKGGNFYSESLQNLYMYEIEKEFEIVAEHFYSNKCEIILDISLSGRHSGGTVKIVLFPRQN